MLCVCPGHKSNPYLNVVTGCNGILPANGALACVYVCGVSLCVHVSVSARVCVCVGGGGGWGWGCKCVSVSVCKHTLSLSIA